MTSQYDVITALTLTNGLGTAYVATLSDTGIAVGRYNGISIPDAVLFELTLPPSFLAGVRPVGIAAASSHLDTLG